jgi:hypothetical protein
MLPRPPGVNGQITVKMPANTAHSFFIFKVDRRRDGGDGGAERFATRRWNCGRVPAGRREAKSTFGSFVFKICEPFEERRNFRELLKLLLR